MRKRSRKLTPELQQIIVNYVREKGRLVGCTIDLPMEISLKTVKNATNSKNNYYIPAFAEAVRQALDDYRALHRDPARDPELKKDAYTKFCQGIKSGRVNVCDYEYFDNGKIKRKVYHDLGVKQWEMEMLFPKEVWSQEAILFVVSNQWDWFLHLQDITEPERLAILQRLNAWKTAALDELQKRGLTTRLIEE